MPQTRPPLRSVTYRPPTDGGDAFPFSVPAIRSLGTLELTTPVTFLVGENGSGKSTLLEGLAAAAGSIAVGAAPVEADDTLRAQRGLGARLKLVWNRRTRRGFFLRAEDFFGFARRASELRAELAARNAELEADPEMHGASDYHKRRALGPVASSLAELERSYGVSLDARSHGEGFLKLFQSRFVPGGLYLLDEPEAPLSPQNQLALIAMLMDMVAQDAQFVIATHSPILLGFPGATILSFDRVPPAAVRFDELEHVRLTREFLNDPDRYLRHLAGG